MRKKVMKISIMLIAIIAIITLGVCWRQIFDASTTSPNLILCKNHTDNDLNMICDKCAAHLPFSDYAEYKTVETISDNGSLVKVEGNMFSDTIVEAKEIGIESTIKLAKQYVQEISDEDIICAYNISMYSDDKKFQPGEYDEAVKVNISNLNIPIKENMALLHVMDDGNYEILSLSKFSANEIEFETSRFSTYILITLGSYNITFSGAGNFRVLDINGVDITNGQTIRGISDFSFSIVPDEDYELTTVTASAGTIEEAGNGFGKTCTLNNVVSDVVVNVDTLELPTFTLNPTSVKINEGAIASFSALSEDAARYEWEYREDAESAWKSVKGKLGFMILQGKTSVLTTNTITEEKSGYQVRCLAYASTTSVKPRISDTALLVTMQDVITVNIRFSNSPNPPIIIPSRASGVWGKTDVSFTMVEGGATEFPQTLQYRINDGEWIDYTGEVTVSNKGITMVYGRAVNQTNPEYVSDEAVIEIRIDNVGPTINVVSQGSSKVEFKAQDEESGIAAWGVTMGMVVPSHSLVDVFESGDILDYWYPTEITTSEIIRTFEGLDIGTYYIWAKDFAGNVSTPVSMTVYKDILAPVGSIEIVGNEVDGVTYVNYTEVTLLLTATDNETDTENLKMKLYNKEEFEDITSFDDIEWEDFTEKYEQWVIPSDNGLKKVYMLLKDEAGNVSLSLK